MPRHRSSDHSNTTRHSHTRAPRDFSRFQYFLSKHNMAPKSWPAEVDVFTIPHSRMKELVQRYLNMMSDINFTNVGHLTLLLENLCNTFKEFYNHEQVENQFIMKKLKEKLQCLSIKNHAVCNCHSDNRLTEMLNLFQDGYKCTEKTDADRINYGIKLRTALEEFTSSFLPHMEEEEEIFQPMLIEYFSYDELCDIKNEVLMHHSINPGQKEVKLEEDDELMCDEVQEKEELEKSEKEYKGIDTLPEELMLKIFSHLNPRELSHCAQVSQRWNELATDGSLWKTILPVQWSIGQWSFAPRLDSDVEEEKVDVIKELMVDVLSDEMVDEDADRDESRGDDSDNSVDDECTEDKQIRKEAAMLTSLVKYLLPRVGSHVKSCYLGYSKGLVNGLLYKILSQCPNMEVLDLSQTRISDIGFKGLGRKGCGAKLKYLNLGGCFNITDTTLKRLSSSFNNFSCEKWENYRDTKEKRENKNNEKDREEVGKCGKCCKLKQGKDKNESDIEKWTEKELKADQVSMQHERKNEVVQEVSAPMAKIHEDNSDSNFSHPAPKVETVPNEPILTDLEESVLLRSLSTVNVSQALEDACDYLENMMKKNSGKMNEPKMLEEGSKDLDHNEKDINTKEVCEVQCLNNEIIAGLEDTDLINAVSQNDSANLVVCEDCSATNQTMETCSQESNSTSCLEKCGHCSTSAKHLHEADVMCSHSHQTTLKFHESKKPKRTTCVSPDPKSPGSLVDPKPSQLQTGYLGHQNTNIVITGERGDDVKICDNDLDLNGKLMNSDPSSHDLEYLSLSGCYHITDTGLRYLAEDGGLPCLRYLDLSGCLNITADGLTELVSVCPALDREELYYCDNVIDGPYAAEASGCQNLECNSRVCCRSGY
ncbi:F-box/LRR-repeat protein 5-like [Mizuhopecten yessoensis]|uniref:F-box/LRR-repeat protein 5-like n=1 Tax=Mizuhopecten yessoensis TaxID=6573 RepID=UPI000B45B59C|nr:F-box/LRR-repeat protein 5-like [Mizuhopecten yessoensis]